VPLVLKPRRDRESRPSLESKKKLAITRHRVCELDKARNTVKRPRSASDTHENPQTLTTSPIVQVKSPRMEMDVAMVEKRKYEVLGEAEEIDEVSTDRDDIMGNSTHGDPALGDNAKDEPQGHQTSLSDVPQPTAPRPRKDVQPTPQDQQLSRITCTVTQTATRPAAVVRLVLSPIGNNINVPPLHFTTQVQASPYKDAEENAKRTDCPNHACLEAEQLLQPAAQPTVEQWPTEAPEVSNTTENRSLEGHDETRQATSNNKNKGTNHIKEKMKVGRNYEEEYVLNDGTTYSSPGGELPFKITEDGDVDEEMDVRQHDKPLDTDNAPKDDEKEKADHEPYTEIHFKTEESIIRKVVVKQS
jgi:hypothetical protein